MSTPNRNMDSPIIIKTEPIRNLIKTGVLSGTSVKFNSKTIAVIGSTEYNTSLNFSVIIFKY